MHPLSHDPAAPLDPVVLPGLLQRCQESLTMAFHALQAREACGAWLEARVQLYLARDAVDRAIEALRELATEAAAPHNDQEVSP